MVHPLKVEPESQILCFSHTPNIQVPTAIASIENSPSHSSGVARVIIFIATSSVVHPLRLHRNSPCRDSSLSLPLAASLAATVAIGVERIMESNFFFKTNMLTLNHTLQHELVVPLVGMDWSWMMEFLKGLVKSVAAIAVVCSAVALSFY
ncbi:hypothetical protein JHK82_012312 [Glycine max]|nr:hypothetical protein JHK82_012312 [Glycine max]